MDIDFHRAIPGKVAARVVGCLEVVIEVSLIAWFIGDVIINAGKSTKGSMFLSNSKTMEVLVGGFFVVGLIVAILLVYSTFAAASLMACKRIVTLWCVYRALSFLASMGLIIQKQGSFDKHCYVIMTGFLIMWALSIYFVSWYLVGLDAEIAKEIPPQFRKRKVSCVSVLTEDSELGDLGSGGEQQWQQFRAYMHRPSWQSSTVSLSGGENRNNGGNGNTLTVPECRF